jgi:hypothetical protein
MGPFKEFVMIIFCFSAFNQINNNNNSNNIYIYIIILILDDYKKILNKMSVSKSAKKTRSKPKEEVSEGEVLLEHMPRVPSPSLLLPQRRCAIMIEVFHFFFFIHIYI